MRVIFLSISVCLLAAEPLLLQAASEDLRYTPDPKIEELIEQAIQATKAAGPDAASQTAAQNACDRITALGGPGEKALRWHLSNETKDEGRLRIAELLARCAPGKVGYRVVLELQPDGSGIMTLSSDRGLLAECAKQHARMMRRPEPVFNDDALRWNPYSKVELLKFLPDDMKFLEAHVEPQADSVMASGMLQFKSFDTLSEFADRFDMGGYQMLSGMTLTDNSAGVRTLRFRKTVEQDKARMQEFLLMFHDVKWEFVLDFKGQAVNHNAPRKDGSKLIWDFNCYQMLAGTAMVEMNYDAARQSPRPASTEGQNSTTNVAAIPGAPIVPVAIPSHKTIRARVFNLTLTRDEMKARAKELREKGYVVELDGRDSEPKGVPMQYQWLQTSGSSLGLSVAALAQPKVGFVIRQPDTYKFELTVTLNGVASKAAEVKIIVDALDPNVPLPPVEPEVKVAESPAVTSAPVPTPPQVAKIQPPHAEVKNVKPPVEVVKAPEKVKPPEIVKSPDVVKSVESTKPVEPKTDPKPVAPQITQKTPPERTLDPVKPDPVKSVATIPPPVKETKAPVAPPEVKPVETTKTEAPASKLDAEQAKIRFAEAQKLMKAGKFAEAKPILADVVAFNPANKDSQMALAVTLMECENLPEALVKFQSLASDSSDPELMMYIGHCYSRSGNLREAQGWYHRGAQAGGEKYYWQPTWQLGNNYLKRKDYDTALETLTSAEKAAARANVSDYRLLRDLAITYHNLHQDGEALKRLEAMEALGYTPDTVLLNDVKLGAGDKKPDVVKQPEVTIKTDVKPIETSKPPENPGVTTKKTSESAPPKVADPAITSKTDPKQLVVVPPKAPATNVNPPAQTPVDIKPVQPTKVVVKEPEKSNTAKVDDPDQLRSVVSAIAKASESDPKPANPAKSTAPVADPNVSKAPESPATPPITVNMTQPVHPVTRKKADPLPAPKRQLPPIPHDFDACMAAGRKAFEEGLKYSELKTEDGAQKASDAWNEAEAMLRGAWAIKPGDEAVTNAFQELANKNGAIALVKNPVVKAKARGLVVLDAESSIVPKGSKEPTLYCVWVQVAGEDLNLRPENLTQKKVGLVIPRPGTYKFELAVSDGVRGGNPVTVTVEVSE